MDHCLPRTHRLQKREAFTHCFDKGKRLRFKGGYAVVVPNAFSHPRLGVIVSKKTCKKAVDRNRMRRLHKEQFRHLKHMLGPLDIALVCVKPAEHEEIEAQWQSLLPLLCAVCSD